VHEICGCGHDWNMPGYVDEAIAKVRAQVGDDEVILGLSGGVDSSVVAALLHRAIGDKLTCVFVDNGLLRLNEGATGHGDLCPQPRRQGDPCRCVSAVHGAPQGRYRSGTEAQDHRPRIRRGISGRSQEAAQGQMAGAGHHLPGRDRIGRAKTKKAHAIKSHHNVGGLPET
jgi:GMP synthase (glutamine-hydrolysing)